MTVAGFVAAAKVDSVDSCLVNYARFLPIIKTTAMSGRSFNMISATFDDPAPVRFRAVRPAALSRESPAI
jgi:hypothetical protein